MDGKKLDNEIVLDESETIGFLASKNEKRSSFSRTDSFSTKILIIPKLSSGDDSKDIEETEKFMGADQSDGSESERPQIGCEDVEKVNLKLDNKNSQNPENQLLSKPKDKQFTGWKRYLGMGLAIFSSCVFSLGILIVKTLKNYPVFSVGIWRFQGVLLPSIPIIIHALFVKKRKVFEPIHPLCELGKLKMFMFLFLRAFCGCGAILFHYYSLKYMDMSDATVIAFSTPVFVTFFAYVCLGEQCGIINILSAIITLIGVTVITRPPFLTGEKEMDSQLLIGAGLALGSMVCASGVFLVLRVLKGIHYSVITFFFGMYGTLECVILSAIIGSIEVPNNSFDWLLALCLAVITFVGQICTTLALQYEEAGPIALCRTFDVIFSFIWQFIFLSVIPSLFSFIGSFIVLAGVFLIGFRKYLSMLPEKHSSRKTFWFMLK